MLQQITLMKKLDVIRNITVVNGVEYIVVMKQCAIATKVSDKKTGSKFIPTGSYIVMLRDE